MDKTPVWLYKILVVGVIVFFIGVGIQPVFANDVYCYKETKENIGEVRASDDYQEIITFIFGYGKINWIERRGIFRGEVETNQEIIAVLSLRGLRLSNNGMEKYNITEVGYIYAPRFIGFSASTILIDVYSTIGLAFGNIEWELIEY